MVDEADSSFEAEVKALREGLRRIRKTGSNQVVAHSDNINLVRLIQRSQILGHWQALEAVQECKRLMGENQSWEMLHIPREQNLGADGLSKLAKNTDRNWLFENLGDMLEDYKTVF